jgi:hypothetical protein
MSQNSECEITTARPDDSGYGVVWFEGRLEKHHRVVFFQHTGEWPEVVMHSCDNPSCINPKHLSAGTHKLNAADRKLKWRNGRIDGQRNGRAKITDEQSEEIIELYRISGLTQRQIGDMYGLSNAQISKIVNRQCFSGKTANSFS